MSGYINVWKDLLTKPAFKRLAKALAAQQGQTLEYGTTLALGALVSLWLTGDSHIRSDDTLDMAAHEVEELLGIKGVMEVLEPNWATVLDAHQICLPGYTAHNNISARKTAQATTRQQNKRARDRMLEGVTQDVTYPRDLVSRTSVTEGVTSHPIPSHPIPTQPKESGSADAPPPLVLGGDQSLTPRLHDSLPLTAWQQWLQYRRQRRLPMSPQALGLHLKTLSAHNPDTQVAMIEMAIANNWKGIFPPRHAAKAAYQAAPTTAELEAQEADRARK